jgi:predicted ATPase
MRVKSIYLENVRGLPTIDLDFFDPVTEQIRTRTVIAGSNGSDKTTILDAIYTLIRLIISPSKDPLVTWLTPNRVKAKLELRDVPALRSLREKQIVPEKWSLVVALGPESWLSQLDAPNLHTLTGDAVNNLHYVHHAPDNIVSPIWAAVRGQIAAEWPTTLYFPSERRELVEKEKGQIVAEPREYEWVWRFSDTPHVQVEGDNGQQFGLDELSSGEKQILLILAEIQRRIRRGSLLLIDEPEIHLHPAWQAHLIEALTDMCRQYDAQMIITTHSEEVARAVYEHELILLDDIFGRRKNR